MCDHSSLDSPALDVDFEDPCFLCHIFLFLLEFFSKSICMYMYQFSSVQLLSRVHLFVTPWPAARQASLSITNFRSLLKLMSIESMMPSNHLILFCPFLLLPSISASIRVFSDESVLCNRWPKYWSFSFRSVLLMNIQD